MISATEQPQVVSDYLEKEWQARRVVKMGAAVAPNIQCSPFGVIPKKSKPGKWRLIIDLSAPEGHSVNDGIRKELASLSYISVDDIVACVLQYGKGALLAKRDIKQAYRNLQVHPQDRVLLGMRWDGLVYVDTALPFGLRSAPLIFTAVADALTWIIQSKGVKSVFHYIDDFVTVGSPECGNNVTIIDDTCEETGLPVELEKNEGPGSRTGHSRA